MSKVRYPNDSQFDEIIQKEPLVLVDFFATWCGPCKMLSPQLDQLAEEYAEKAVIVKIDVDQHRELANRFAVSSIPNLLVFKNGKLVDNRLGFQAYPVLKEMLK